jgi:acetolactate synthase-1/2/3 large subunit
MMRHGGQILARQLELQGVRAVFTVPGESFLAALDGLHDTDAIQTVICRQEGGASMMADAWGKITGQPGVCFVTRGPGLANAMAGLHVAKQDSTPLVLFLGLPALDTEDREAFQEIETKGVLSTFVKWVAVIRETRRIPEYVSHAFHVAQSGRPGPVVLGLPEDMLSAMADVADAKPVVVAELAPSRAAMADLASRLARARAPVMMIGGPGWTARAADDIAAFAARHDVPIASAFRYQDYMDNRHHHYVGCAGIGIDATLSAAIKTADLLIVVGARMGEMTTSAYTLLDIPDPKQTLVHVHPSADELGSVYRADLPIVARTAAFAAALAEIAPAHATDRRARVAELRTAYLATLKPLPTPGAVQMPDIVRHVSDAIPDDAIVTNGAGNYAAFLHRYFTYKGYRTCLAPTSGSMGYGLPAAIAAKLAHPERTVVNFAGDGCFLMTGQELGVAMQYNLPIVTIIANNGMYGTIRMHQEREYPARIVGTSLVNPNFAAYAQAFGAHGEQVTRTEDFPAAFARARAAKVPSIIELAIDPEAISVRQTIAQLRGAKR